MSTLRLLTVCPTWIFRNSRT